MATLAARAVPGSIAYLGPSGTFSEEALLSEADLAASALVPAETIGAAIAAVVAGDVDAAFVPIENSIEGSVNATIDELIFGEDLFIQREVVLEVHLDLLAMAGANPEDLRAVLSFPHASAQCRQFVTNRLSSVELRPTNSTAEAVRIVAEAQSSELGAIAPGLCAKLYGLDVLAHAIEDHAGNATRFVLIAPNVVPTPSGHDRTAIVCFQHSDRPGSLQQILGQFAARRINLTRIESRPTKRALGDYCFVIEFEGHIGDEVVGDCLTELHGVLEEMKFLGSYPVTGEEATAHRDEHEVRRDAAYGWLAAVRARVG